MRFDQIIGHKRIKDYIQNAIQSQKISHAYIFDGEEGSGKKELAKLFAQTLQCEEGGIEPCGHCQSCKQAENGNNPDIMWITHEKAGIGVDDIRTQLNSDIQIMPYKGPYKIYIIDEAEKMNEAAQNAMLKTIEEPPEYAVIMLLTTNSDSFLQTILSRCIKLELRAVASQEIVRYLMERREVPDYQAEEAAAFSGGNVGKALKYVSSGDFFEKRELITDIVKNIKRMPPETLQEKVKLLAEKKNEAEDYFDLIMMWYRDILIYKSTQNVNMVLFKKEINDILKLSAEKTYENIENVINAVTEANGRLKASVNFDTTMFLLLMTMKEN